MADVFQDINSAVEWRTWEQGKRIYSISHGLTTASVGKPIGWKADGKPYVWTDTATTEIPVAVVAATDDSNHIIVAPIGAVVDVATSLLPASMPVNGNDTNSRLLYWDNSAGAYKHFTQGDSKADHKIIYYIGVKEGDSNTAQCIVCPPGTNKDKTSVVANVLDFGALRDGTTDDRVRIQAAIDSGRPIVYFPGSQDGTVYYISNYIELETDYQQLVGDGPSSIIHCDHQDSCVIYAHGTSESNRMTGASVNKLWIQGCNATISSPTQTTGTENGVGVRIYYAHEFSLHECLISHCHGHAVHLYKNGEVVIRDNWFFGQYYADNWNQTAEIYQNDGNQSVLVRDNHFHSNIRLHLFLDGDQGQYREISRNVSFACSSEGVILQPQYSETTNSSDGYSIVKHNYALCYGPDINTDTAGRCIFEGNLAWAGRWTNLYYNSYNPTPDDIGLRLVVANNIFMAGGWYNNEAYASTTLSAAVNIQAGREVLLTGNLILDAKCHPLANPAVRVDMIQDQGFVQITNNVISNAFCGGIYLAGVTANHVIQGNYVFSGGGRGLFPIHIYNVDSIAAAKTVSSIDTGTNVITSNAHGLGDGERVRFAVSGGSYFRVDGVPIDSFKLFYVRDSDANTFKIAETPNGSALDITATYSGTLTVQHIQYLGANLVADNVIVTDVTQKISPPIEFAAASVNPTTNRITLVNHGITGVATQKIVFNNSTPANLFAISSVTISNDTVYYGRYVDADTFEVATTSGGSAADITAAGSGTHSIRMISESPGGIYYYIDNETEPGIIRDNLVISHQPQPSGYGPAGYGIQYHDTGPKVISDNYISGFATGIYLSSSHTARAVDTIRISGNYIRNAAYGVTIPGSSAGLVLVDDTNQFTGSGSWKVRQDGSYVGLLGNRRNAKVFAAQVRRANKTLTVTNGQANLTSTSHGYENGERVQLSGTIPSPFAASTNYWIVNKATNTVQLSTSRGGSAVTPTADGSCTMSHFLPAFGTWAVGDTIVNDAWASGVDVREWVCTGAGSLGTWVALGNVGYGGYVAVEDGDTTPAVDNARTLICDNTNPTTITGFDGGTVGQCVRFVVMDDQTTFRNYLAAGTELPIALLSGRNYLAHYGDVLEFVKISNDYWREVGQTPHIVNVMDFGVAGDGVEDDTDGINSAIAAQTSLGGEVYFPPGTYLISSALVIGSGIHLRGSGATIKQSTNNIPIISVTSGALNSNWSISQLTLTYSSAQGSGNTSAAGILLGTTSKSSCFGRVSDVKITNACFGVYLPNLSGASCYEIQFDVVEIVGCSIWGFNIIGDPSTPNTTGLSFRNCWVRQVPGSEISTSAGFSLAYCRGITIDNCGCDHIRVQPSLALTTASGIINSFGVETSSFTITSGMGAYWFFNQAQFDVGALYAYNNSVNISGTSDWASVRLDATSRVKIHYVQDTNSSVTTADGAVYYSATASSNDVLKVFRFAKSGASPSSNISIDAGIRKYIQEWDGNVRTTLLGSKVHTTGTTAPATETWAVGDIVWNTSPSDGGNIGWVCTSAGSPGTWRTFGTISS